MFAQNKEELNDYHANLQAETAERKNGKTEASPTAKPIKKSYFKRDQWKAPNVIKTNLIQPSETAAGELDWTDNVNLLMVGVSCACFIVILAYLGLQIDQSFSAQKGQKISEEIQNLNVAIATKKKGLGDIDVFQKKLDVAGDLLKSHIYWTQFFKFWEDNLLQDVFFSEDFIGDLNNQYTLRAVTTSYANAANQIKLLRSDSNNFITKLEIGSADYSEEELEQIAEKAAEGGMEKTVSFELDVEMDPKIFHKDN